MCFEIGDTENNYLTTHPESYVPPHRAPGVFPLQLRALYCVYSVCLPSAASATCRCSACSCGFSCSYPQPLICLPLPGWTLRVLALTHPLPVTALRLFSIAFAKCSLLPLLPAAASLQLSCPADGSSGSPGLQCFSLDQGDKPLPLFVIFSKLNIC